MSDKLCYFENQRLGARTETVTRFWPKVLWRAIFCWPKKPSKYCGAMRESTWNLDEFYVVNTRDSNAVFVQVVELVIRFRKTLPPAFWAQAKMSFGYFEVWCLFLASTFKSPWIRWVFVMVEILGKEGSDIIESEMRWTGVDCMCKFLSKGEWLLCKVVF